MPPAAVLDAPSRALLEGKVEDLVTERNELRARLDLVQRLEGRNRELEAALRDALALCDECGPMAPKGFRKRYESARAVLNGGA